MFNFNKKYNILVLGNDGMLGHDLYEELKRLSASRYSNIGIVVGIDKEAGIDLSLRHSLGNFLIDKIHFDYCINCVAYTNTKAAETTKDGKKLDYKLNALAPRYIAESCKFFGTKLIHISTDYVFSEFRSFCESSDKKTWTPFTPNEETFPINVYGYDKLIGEYGIQEVYGKDSDDYAILRVSWLYGNHNHKSFIHKFLNNMVNKLKENADAEITMTSNEVSVPTSVTYVIDCIKDVIANKKHGIFHAVPEFDNYGVSRLEFAQAVLYFLSEKIDNEKYLINGKKIKDIKLTPKEIDAYYPKYSAMLNPNNSRNTIGKPLFWREDLQRFINKNLDDLITLMFQEI